MKRRSISLLQKKAGREGGWTRDWAEVARTAVQRPKQHKTFHRSISANGNCKLVRISKNENISIVLT